MTGKKIVCAVSLQEDSLLTMERVLHRGSFQGAQIHLVHIFKIETYLNELSSYVYPTPEMYPEITKTVESILAPLQQKITRQLQAVECTIKCIFHHRPKEELCQYLSDQRAQMVVVATRGKHGLEGFFSSSFTDYLCKFSPCDVLVLRPELKEN